MDLDLPRAHRSRRSRATNRELDLGQALDGAALGTHEVRMRAFMLVRRIHRLEAPHVIADIGAPREPSLGEIDEVAIDRGAIPSVRGEAIGDVTVRHGRVARAQQLEHRDARGRGAEPAIANAASSGRAIVCLLRQADQYYSAIGA